MLTRMQHDRLLVTVCDQFRINRGGYHGAPHWARVRANGLKLAEQTGADTTVVEMFALLHDSQRDDEDRDPQHGQRAAEYIKTLRAEQPGLLPVDDRRLELLLKACELHSEGQLSMNSTVATCWDADRLDLGRVGIIPSADFLSTDAARDPRMFSWALARSLR